VALGVGIAAWFLWLAWSLRRIAAALPPDSLARAWRGVDARLTRSGHPRAPHEGVLAYCERLARTHPVHANAILPMARNYAQLRYGPPAAAGELRDFVRAARRFSRKGFQLTVSR
jgi:hypothetical protein